MTKTFIIAGLFCIVANFAQMGRDTAPHGTVTVGAPTAISEPIASR